MYDQEGLLFLNTIRKYENPIRRRSITGMLPTDLAGKMADNFLYANMTSGRDTEYRITSVQWMRRLFVDVAFLLGIGLYRF